MTQEQAPAPAEQTSDQGPTSQAQSNPLTKETQRMVMMPDGSVETQANVDRMREEGYEASGPYSNGRRS